MPEDNIFKFPFLSSQTVGMKSDVVKLMDLIPLGVCIVDEDFRIVFWNHRLEEWTCKSSRETIGNDLLKQYPHLAEEKYSQRFRMVFDGGPPALFSPQLHPHFIPAQSPNGDLRIQQTTVSILLSDTLEKYLIISIDDMTNQMLQLKKTSELHKKALHEISERKIVEEERERLIEELQSALSKIKILSGFIPICSHCKKIRDDKGFYHQIEKYISEHSEAIFSHGICPECMMEHYPDFFESRQ